ncbi:MAG: DUF4276 family protein [Ignavibacteriales bacterium]|nr:DUF4276 family protein [Ignavibacteriales bacterium]
MHLEVLVEEPSAEAALQNLLPKILSSPVTFKIIVHQGKSDLLKKLAPKLKSYAKWIGHGVKIVVLVDKDRNDCKELKKWLNKTAADAGLVIKTNVGDFTNNFQILNRIAVEELEAWFLGDKKAITKSYRRVKIAELEKPKFSNPDTIANTWEELEKLLQKYGYYQVGLSKIQNARIISGNMDINHNTSPSFNAFRDGLHQLPHKS